MGTASALLSCDTIILMPDSHLSDLTRSVVRYFQRRANAYGLDPRRVSARYLLNWGGFVNASFHVSDGQRAYHLKLTDDEDSLASLARWMALRAPLEARYRAPRILSWIALEDSDFAGLLFEHLDAQPASYRAQPALHAAVLALAAKLHADRELAEALRDYDAPDGASTAADCAATFIETYIDRFDEDLLAVAGALPPFVPLATLDWMQGETRHLEALARESASFQQPAGSPIHGDLWEQNVLVRPDGRWFVVDWDDLTLGDPALEYGILLGPLLAHLPPNRRGDPPALPRSALLRKRFALYLRAYLLDQVIDTLADYVESDFAPEHQAEVQAEKQRAHLHALRLYQSIYPD